METNELGTDNLESVQHELVVDGATALSLDEEITREQRRSRRKRRGMMRASSGTTRASALRRSVRFRSPLVIWSHDACRVRSHQAA